jgi:flavin-dependent dehydrogenase
MNASAPDVVILGGALAGASTALLLRREHPGLRVLIVESSTAFGRKVGEATTEVSGEFFHRRLSLARHLTHEHLAKQSLRMWFTGDSGTPFDETVEIGSDLLSRYPAYQLDRAVLDEHLLALAAGEGAEVWRPAEVVDVDFGSGGSVVTIQRDGGTQRVSCRWVLDATGRKAFLAKKLGLHRKLEAHPTAALWARFKGVRDWDGHELRARHTRYGSTVLASRAAATNHLVGLGWWCWIIPLRGGDFSAGLVYDTRLFKPPQGSSPAERLLAHIRYHPVGREIFKDAVPVEGDCHARAPLPYYSQELAGPGWQLVGDAAGFIDPLYSPGMDYVSWTARTALARIAAEIGSQPMDLGKLNADWRESYHSWFETLYKDKYYYLGDAELMSSAYLMDIGLFFVGPARTSLVEQGGDDARCLPFVGPVDRIVGKFMRLYNTRLARIARKRVAAGCYGCRNTGWQELYRGMGPKPGVLRIIAKGFSRWIRAEIHALGLRPLPPQTNPSHAPPPIAGTRVATSAAP